MLEFIDKFLERRRMAREGQLGTRKRRTESVFGAAMDRSMAFTLALVVILWGVCVTVLTIPMTRDYPTLVNGQQSPATFYAQTDFEYEDKAGTEQQRVEITSQPPKIFNFDHKRTVQIQDNLKKLKSFVNERHNTGKINYSSPNILAEKTAALSPDAFKLVESVFSSGSFATFEKKLNSKLKCGILKTAEATPQAMVQQNPSDSDKTPGDWNSCATVAADLTGWLDANNQLSASDNDAVKALMLELLTPDGNLVLNEELSRKELEFELQNIEPLMIRVKKHDVIIKRNDRVNSLVLDALSAEQEVLKQKKDGDSVIRDLLYNAFWSLILVLFAGFYLVHIHPEVTRSARSIALIVTVSTLALVINYFSMELFYFFSSMLEIPPQLLPDAVPLALTAVLLTVMSGYRVALYVGLFVSMVSAMMLKGSFNVALEGFVLSALCGLMVRPSGNYRSFFLRTFICVGATVWLLDFNWFWHLTVAPGMILYSLLLALANALFTAVTAMLLIFLFELIFNVSTNMSLMVLCDYNHPLLKELHLKAPGTSLHSQNVAVLAENAAIEIGANAVLARAGALFHDIGKIKNPEYFIENNQSGTNPHDRLSPRMSSLIISTHVKDGLDMALQYKICRKVRRFIQQHHGTDLIQYFYHIAMNTQEQVLESDYRYPGPLPHEKEVVIVSLADACEAACRSLEKPTASKIEGMVNDIFRKRWRDGQLDEADLTVEELSLINESFVYTLTTMYHSRIAYPKDDNNDEDNLLVPEQAPSGTEQKAPAPGNE